MDTIPQLLFMFVGSLVLFLITEVSAADVAMNYGKPAVLVCDLGNLQEHPALRWFHDGKEIKADGELYEQKDINSSLTILHAREGDEGEYTCNFTTTGNAGMGSAVVKLNAKPFVNKFSKKSENKVQGESVELVCNAWGFDYPKITWFKNNDTHNTTLDFDLAVSEDEDAKPKYELKTSEDSKSTDNVLVINDLQYEDYATYVCRAKNDLGTTSAAILLRVKDKLGALWPFLGIVLEVLVLCLIIFVYEHRRAKRLAAEDNGEQQEHLMGSSDMDGEPRMASSRLFSLIHMATSDSLCLALADIDDMTDEQVSARHLADGSTYLHHLVASADRVHEQCGSVKGLVPLVYRLATRGVSVNARNSQGNTCLHLACVRPKAESLCVHLIRVGVDPCILNEKGCRVIHNYQGHFCYIVKGEKSAKCGLWNAVAKEDSTLCEQLLRSWCRVRIRKNKSLDTVADETGNQHIYRLLQKHAVTNEMVVHAFAGNVEKVMEFIKAGADVHSHDESCEPPMPLVVALAEIGPTLADVLRLFYDYHTQIAKYEACLSNRQREFESTTFYNLLEAGGEDSLCQALLLVEQIDVNLTSVSPEREGWTFLHYVVARYYALLATGGAPQCRVLVRILYRLALRGACVNRRDAQGRTLLLLAAAGGDQALIAHILRIGGDPQLTMPDGCTCNEEIYANKGKLVFDRQYRQADLPGLWVAISMNDVGKAERWLKSWARVNTRHNGDRRMLEIARDKQLTEIVKLLEVYEHINEFVCATFACDLKLMMHLLALGKGAYKVNTIDDFFHVGFTYDSHAEYMARPIIVSAIEICTPEVVDFLLTFGADLSKEYEESHPCGPMAFWAFRDEIDNRNTLVVAQHADVGLNDELGCTMLHRAIEKRPAPGQTEIVQTLLERKINIAVRDHEGSTARDYVIIYDVIAEEGYDVMTQIIDDHVIEMVMDDAHEHLEDLVVESYNHISDIRDKKRHKSVLEIAQLKEFKEIMQLMEDYIEYKSQIARIHAAAQAGEVLAVAKLAGEKRCAWSRDMAGRTALHTAVMWGHNKVAKLLLHQHPQLAHSRDSMQRTPLHYCVCLEERKRIWSILQDGGADPNLTDVNNLSVYDYVRELETPSAIKDRPRGRRHRYYQPALMLSEERSKQYGVKAECYTVYRALRAALQQGVDLSEMTEHTAGFPGSLTMDDLDLNLLSLCVRTQREEVAKHIIEMCGARLNPMLKVNEGEPELSLAEHAASKGLHDLVNFIREREAMQ